MAKVGQYLFGVVNRFQYVCRFCTDMYGFEGTCLRCYEGGWFFVRGFDSGNWMK